MLIVDKTDYKPRSFFALIAMLVAFSILGVAHADSSADNSKLNKQRSNQEVTAEQQSNAKEDLQITRKIRQEIVKDKSLSFDAHNVKIITDKGKVILKGPVQSEKEKSVIEQKATLVAGADNVRDQLEVIKQN